jgi:phage gp36-like protein
MSVYYSSETTIKAKIKGANINLWGDRNRDDVLDATTLAQALLFSRELIRGYLQPRYGAQVHDWTLSSVPGIVRDISDTLTIYYIATGQNAIAPIVQILYDNAIMMLGMIADYKMDIPEVTDTSDYDTLTAEYNSEMYNDDDDLEDDDYDDYYD